MEGSDIGLLVVLLVLLGAVVVLGSLVLSLVNRVNELSTQVVLLSSQQTTEGSGCAGLFFVVLALVGTLLLVLTLGS